MIIRILEDGQYRLDSSHLEQAAQFAQLDGELVREMESNDASGFARTLHRLIAQVHAAGRAVPLEELVPSDVIVPAEDMTLAETVRVLPTGR